MNNFTDWLNEQLNKRDWSQADLARAAGLTRGGVSNLMNQVRKPDPETLIAIARALNLPPETVFRAAGLLPQESKIPPTLEETNYKLSLLSESEQKQVLDYIDFILEKREKKNAKADNPRRNLASSE